MMPDVSLRAFACVLLKEGVRAKRSVVRAVAAFLIGETADRFASEELRSALLKEKDSGVRFRVAEAVGKTCDAACLGPLEDTLESDHDTLCRASAAEALGRVCRDTVPRALTDALNDKDILVRVAAAEALLRHHDASGSRHIYASLKSRNAYARRWACAALVTLGEASACARLEALAQHDPDAIVRIWAARAILLLQHAPLGSEAAERNFAFIASKIKARLASVRSRAVCALADLGLAQCVPLLEEALRRDRNFMVRLWAADALSRFVPAARTALTESMQKDRHPVVRIWAAQAMGDSGVPLIEKFIGGPSRMASLHAAKALLCVYGHEKDNPA